MTQTKMLCLGFNESIPPEQLPDFRHALTDFLGFTGNYLFEGDWPTLEKDWLGEYQGKTFSCLLSFPLLQLKWMGETSREQLHLIAFGDRVERIIEAFNTTEDPLVANGGVAYMMEAKTIRDTTFTVRFLPTPRKYALRRYIPCTGLESEHLLRSDSIHQRHIIEHSLSRHILLFLLAIGMELESPLEIRNLKLGDRIQVPTNSIPFFGIDLEFHCNLQLPPQLGLGCKAELGYGLLK